MLDQIFASEYAHILLPLLIFVSRIMDVSLGTMRYIYISKGFKTFAALVGFFESLIWVLAIGQIFKDVSGFSTYLFYAGGYATGTYVGMKIEETMRIGMVILRVVPRQDTHEIIEILRDNGFGVTSLEAEGKNGKVDMFFTVLKRKNLTKAVQLIQDHNPQAFYTIEDVRVMKDGFQPATATIAGAGRPLFRPFHRNRK